MGATSKIQWCGPTWNTHVGCRWHSLGCQNCYMFRDMERYGKEPRVVVRTKPKTFNYPIGWQSEARRGERVGTNRLVFTCSWSDWFIEEADAWRDEAWEIIRRCPDLVFQILTKRADRIADHLPLDWGSGWPNVWLGVSVEDQKNAEKRIRHLLGVPAKVRFLSVEPLLSEVHLPFSERVSEAEQDAIRDAIDAMGGIPDNSINAQVGRYHRAAEAGIHWVIVGGESGNATGKYIARPCDVSSIRSVVEQCKSAGVPCFVKQLGSKPYDSTCRISIDGPDSHAIELSLRDRSGGDPAEWPEDLRVREFPAAFAEALS